MDWIDAHCHLTDQRIADTLETLLDGARKRGITSWVMGGVSPDDWERQIALKADLGESLVTCFGVHPWWVSSHSEKQIASALETLKVSIGQAQAIGELGLDRSSRFLGEQIQKKQKAAFQAQLELAKIHSLPLVFHIVRAHEDALAVILQSGWEGEGLVHSFSGDLKTARKYLDRGLHLSLCGAFLRGHEALKKAIPHLPADRLVIETDAPDQLPAGFPAWGEGFNEPAHLLGIAEAVGKLRNESRETVLENSRINLRRLFYGD